MTTQETYLEQIEHELKQTPVEYLPALLNMIHAFRETVWNLNETSVVSNDSVKPHPFNDLFGIVKATHSVSLEEIELAISEQGVERKQFIDSLP
jgi:hypothetical protein